MDGGGELFASCPSCWKPVLKILDVHPQYSRIYYETIEALFYSDDGPLPFAYRHYIAIMAASRHFCEFAFDLHMHEYVAADGDPQWLEGLEYVPRKLRDLDKLNRLLAHQPWLVQVSHIQELAKGGGPDNWSLSELVHAILLLAHVHAFCSFVCGIGIQSSPGTPNGFNRSPRKNGSFSYPAVECGGISRVHGGSTPLQSPNQYHEVEQLMARMKELSECESRCSQEDRVKHFVDTLNEQNLDTAPENGAKIPVSPDFDCARYTQDLNFGYVDFCKRGDASSAPVLKSHEYSWEDQGFSLLGQISEQISTPVDYKFRVIKSLTYFTMAGHEGVDTSKYRVAVWNYIQSLFGIRHDDFDYAEINQMLSRPMKTYIKTVCCFPQRSLSKLPNSVMSEFQWSEKVHVNLIISEARMQAELLYALRAVMRFMT